jgi:uncharacterized protein with WD repeat
VSLYQYDLVKKQSSALISSRTIFGASEAGLLWSSLGTAVLVHSHSDVDNVGASYYGATGLYIMRTDSDSSSIVEQSKEGPIHDVKWSPIGDRFVVSAGHMPCNNTLFNEKVSIISVLFTVFFFFMSCNREMLSTNLEQVKIQNVMITFLFVCSQRIEIQ